MLRSLVSAFFPAVALPAVALAAMTIGAQACTPSRVQEALGRASAAFDSLREGTDPASLKARAGPFAEALAGVSSELAACACPTPRELVDEAAAAARAASAATDDDALVDALNEAASAFGRGLEGLAGC